MADDKRAARLFALAITARERGDFQAADEMMKLALESTEHTTDMPPPASPTEQPVAQQQQQIQPKKEDL